MFLYFKYTHTQNKLFYTLNMEEQELWNSLQDGNNW